MQWTDSGGGDFEQPEAGTYNAKCYRVIDIGTQTSSYEGKEIQRRQVVIGWEIDEKMSDGRPFVVSSFFTASLSEKANLRKIMTSWRGRDFTADELAGFDPKNIIGAPCMLTLSLTDKGKIKVTAVSKLPKGMNPLTLTNETMYITLEAGKVDEDLVAKLGQGLQKMIHNSPEWSGRHLTANKESVSPKDPMDEFEDDIPF